MVDILVEPFAQGGRGGGLGEVGHGGEAGPGSDLLTPLGEPLPEKERKRAKL